MTLSKAKADSIINNLSSIAETVYDCVPEKNSVTTAQVTSEMHRRGKNSELRKIEGCLSNLMSKGLINNPDKDTWIRVQIHKQRKKTLTSVPKPAKQVDLPMTIHDQMITFRAELEQFVTTGLDLVERFDALSKKMEVEVGQLEEGGKKMRMLRELLREE